ncbi:hypothetical protein LBK6_13130 [Leptospira borgpetersenii serovar Hardjo]|nr:hypothetical protein LBK6_13130 [Leptospira borgpetersenii serovar Hardjo]AWV70977.1 hypothetical protein B9T54_14045 [Leptospira borgpetersenii serovar Hardjo-bovis]AMX62466.1 hypothetical protein LBK9_13040 [Leptospira borgpetersenii serovar Hardjo]AMX65708.1 hypothetical protein LBK30_13055 [Leptospira borgpetersenii serovar Hardjo]AMX68941.1 hypothetical protein LBHA_13010 [Leptospira borgpetersenii serovar Hardjo]
MNPISAGLKVSFQAVFCLEPVSKPKEKYLSTIRQVFKKRGSSHRNRRIGGFLPSFKIVIALTFLRF